MPEIVIKRLSELQIDAVLPGMTEIFFESSTKKEFKDAADRAHFIRKYLGYYLEKGSDQTWVALGGENVFGYITGLTTSEGAELLGLQPQLLVFKDLFTQYPAHLHINTHHETRGSGLGSKLLKEFEKDLLEKGIPGVHLITSPSSRNRDFYLKNGYSFESIRPFLQTELLFMGKIL